MESSLFNQPPTDLKNLVTLYNSNLLRASLIDKHAPLKYTCLTNRPSASWYTPKVTEEKRKRWRLEMKWLFPGLTIDRENNVYQF